VQLDGRLAEERAEGVRANHLVGNRLDQAALSRRRQLRQRADQLPLDCPADPLPLERLNRTVGEVLLVEEVKAGVCRDGAREQCKAAEENQQQTERIAQS
jgi:hypothetical protein